MSRRPNAQLTLALVVALMAAVALVAGTLAAESREDPAPEPVETEEVVDGVEASAAPGSSGLRVYLDPETGRMRSRPVDPEAPRPPRRRERRLNTYGADLLQERLPNGGFKVDLRGRFQSSVVATIDPETDAVQIDCITAPVAEVATAGATEAASQGADDEE